MARSFDSSAIYHQYSWEDEAALDRAWRVQTTRVLRHVCRGRFLLRDVAAAMSSREAAMLAASDRKLVDTVKSRCRELRKALTVEDSRSPELLDALAAIRESTRRVTGMRLHDVQMHGALCMLMGRIAEMQTGEGKSLTAVPVAVVAAVAGFPIHIITVNEYLASRDAAEFLPVYEQFELEVGLITDDLDPSGRSIEYRKPIVYATNKDIAFDHMRDRLARKHFYRRGLDLLARLRERGSATLLPGLHFALVDEADSVLLDEAGTPLIIARESNIELEETLYRSAMRLAAGLVAERDYIFDDASKGLRWTPEGRNAIALISEIHGGLWSGPRRTQEWLEKCLRALHSYRKGRDYIVVDDEVHIVDPNTGRRMPDRQWEGGMHQLVQVKERVPLTPRRETLAKTTYQKFFRRYWRVAGMSGTVSEVRDEIYSTYAVAVETIATHQPCRRKVLPAQLLRSREHMLDSLLDAVSREQARGRPILIGTQSVEDSEAVSSALRAADFEHQLLNAVNDATEAAIVERAGSAAAITVATNMAGRGTDIRLDELARESGGLHVIAFGISHSRRVDRQLGGRCARQGDPGSYQLLACLDDDVFGKAASPIVRLVARATSQGTPGRWQGPLATMVLRAAQRRVERRDRLNRAALLAMEEKLPGMLAFTGTSE